jgi:1-acyl-sn-glycerol-3-phosphate acyltransferase
LRRVRLWASLRRVRALFRLLGILVVTLLMAPLPLLVAVFTLGSPIPMARAGRHLMRAWSRICCRILGVRIEMSGNPPSGAHLFASNHLSYLDILVLGACHPTLFLSMAEVARWPLVGPLARLVGTLFIRRTKATDVGRVQKQMAAYLSRGLPITIFPEAHPSCGQSVMPFHSALFEVAVRLQLPCVPVSLRFEAPGASEPPSRVVCWWGDMEFVSHFRKLLTLRRVEARVCVGSPIPPGDDRRALALALHDQVLASFVPVRQVS